MLIYDGDCSFCTRVASFGKKRMRKAYKSVSWQSIADKLGTYRLTQAEVSQRVYWVEDEIVVGGSKAVFLAGRHLKQPWAMISRIFSLPGMIYLTEPIYNFVAKNRHKLPGGSDACKNE